MASPSHNPVLARAGWDTQVRVTGPTMTLAGTMAKTTLMLGLVAAGMVYAWVGLPPLGLSTAVVYPLLTGSFVVAVILLIATSFRPEYAAITGPVYAAMQGVVLGIVTLILSARLPGLPMQAALLTLATLGVMLAAYRSGAIQVTERLRSTVVSCTAAIFVFYVIAFGLSLFGLHIPFLHEGGLLGIGFSLFVTGLAAFNLLLDFDAIEGGIGRAPAEMEWFAAFGLVVTLVWLYMEMLRLLRKVRG